LWVLPSLRKKTNFVLTCGRVPLILNKWQNWISRVKD
jgi:hypothetical protein